MDKDTQSRFTHLLQPIRDLTKNWDIDVASQLEEYLAEIEQITISFDGESTKMNFAEAALLIQGSTCVYSKKVEYLYALVYQTLDLIASKRKLAQASSVDERGQDTDISFAQRKEEDKLLALDDIPEATNIDLVETLRDSNFKSVSTIPRTPMSLIPLQESEKAATTPLLSHTGEVLGSKLDFKMNTSTVHSSGALLLEPTNQLVIELKLLQKEPIRLTYNTPVEKIKELLPGIPDSSMMPPFGNTDEGPMFAEDGRDRYTDDEDGASEPLHSPLTSDKSIQQKPVRRSARVKVKDNKIDDPWRLLDPHEPNSRAENKPFKKGATFRLLPSLKKPKSRKRKNDNTLTPSEPIAQFILRSFYSCSSMFPKNPLKAPLSSEFEGLYWAEQKARKLQKHKDNTTLSHLRKQSTVALEEEVVAGEPAEEDNVEDYQPLGAGDDDDDGGSYFTAGMAERFEGALEKMQDHLQVPGGNASGTCTSFQGIEPMALDEPSNDQQIVVQNYEDLVRNYVESTLASALVYAQETSLSRRVQEWEDRIKPTLAEEELHPVFDIHHYGTDIMKEFEKRNCPTKDGKLYFCEIAGSKQQYEICRLFSATLQLANDYNIEISVEGVGEQAVDTMGLQLLSTQMAHENVSSYRAPSLQGRQSLH